MSMAQISEGWKKTPTGYELTTAKGVAVLRKKGRRWFLDFVGQSIDLGRRASFDSAEGIISKLL